MSIHTEQPSTAEIPSQVIAADFRASTVKHTELTWNSRSEFASFLQLEGDYCLNYGSNPIQIARLVCEEVSEWSAIQELSMEGVG